MNTEVVQMTPERAEQLLLAAESVRNRSVMKTRVAQYARAMTLGQWRVTHQAVALDTEGILIDGQHRLRAVVEAGVPVWMSLTSGVPRETMDAIDTGATRSAAQILHLEGYTDTAALSSTIRCVLVYDALIGTRLLPTGAVRSQYTPRDILNVMETPRGDIIRSNFAAARTIAYTLGRVGMRSWIGAGLSLIDENDPETDLRHEFVDKLISGAMLAERSPILTFRRWATSDIGYERVDRNVRQNVGIAAMIRAWNAWVNQEDMSHVRMNPGRDEWPAVEAVTMLRFAAEDVDDPESVGVLS